MENGNGKKAPFWKRHRTLSLMAIALALVLVGSQFANVVRKPPEYSYTPPSATTAERMMGAGVTKPGESPTGFVGKNLDKLSGYGDWVAGRINPHEKLEKAKKSVPQIYVFLKFAKFRVIYERDANGQFVPERNAAGDIIATTYGRPMLKIKKIVPYTQWYIATGSGTIIYAGQDPYRSQVGPRYHSLVLTANHIVAPIRYFMKPLPTFLQDPVGRETAYIWEMEILYDWRIEGNLSGIWFPLDLPEVDRPKSEDSLKRLNEAMKELGGMAERYAAGVFSPMPVVTSNIGKMSIDTGLPPDLQKQLLGLPYYPISPEVLQKIDPRQLEMSGSAPELDIAILEARDKVFPDEVVFHFKPFGRSDPESLQLGADVWLLGYPSGYNLTANAGKVNGRISFGNPPWVNLIKLDISSSGGSSGGPVLAVDQGFKLVGILMGGLVNIQMTRVPDPELPEFYDPITGLPGVFPKHPFLLIPGEPRNEDLSWDTVKIPIPGFALARGVDDIVAWMSLKYNYVFGARR